MPRLGSGLQFSRITLITINVVFLLLGFAILGFGIFILVNGNFSAIVEAYNITQSLGTGTMKWIGIAMIVAGFLTVFISAFGFLGAVAKKRTFLYFYAFIFVIILLIEFAGVILLLVHRNQIWNSYDSGFSDVFKRAYRQNQTEAIKAIEKLETSFKCCGVNGSIDYIMANYKIPKSCYINQNGTGAVFPKGCSLAVTQWALDELPVFVAIIGVILFIELFGLISSLVIGVALSRVG